MKTLYRTERDAVPYYFGLSLGYASATLHPSKHPYFLQYDSVLVAEPLSSPGYSLRLMATARLNKRWEIRTNPGLVLGIERTIQYTLGKRQLFEDEKIEQKIQSNIATFPFHVKFNSDRIDNFKVYMLAGVKYDIDLASNAQSRNAEDMVKLKASDFGAELGIGFNFFLPFVTVSPEIKFSNGFGNIHARDPSLKYSSVFDRLQSRMVFFTLHLEQ
ncbi:MAG: PorT family protein [Chitinophagaceae bacterium]|jgi:hypothetical protein|nr:PorT family protein [Chitinophagaceae bacterium]